MISVYETPQDQMKPRPKSNRLDTKRNHRKHLCIVLTQVEAPRTAHNSPAAFLLLRGVGSQALMVET